MTDDDEVVSLLAQEREVPEGFFDGNKRLAKILEGRPDLAEKVKKYRESLETSDNT